MLSARITNAACTRMVPTSLRSAQDVHVQKIARLQRGCKPRGSRPFFWLWRPFAWASARRLYDPGWIRFRPARRQHPCVELSRWERLSCRASGFDASQGVSRECVLTVRTRSSRSGGRCRGRRSPLSGVRPHRPSQASGDRRRPRGLFEGPARRSARALGSLGPRLAPVAVLVENIPDALNAGGRNVARKLPMTSRGLASLPATRS